MDLRGNFLRFQNIWKIYVDKGDFRDETQAPYKMYFCFISYIMVIRNVT